MVVYYPQDSSKRDSAVVYKDTNSKYTAIVCNFSDSQRDTTVKLDE